MTDDQRAIPRSWAQWADEQCHLIDQVGRWRIIRDFDSNGPAGVLDGTREVISFASNDYLGLTQHPSVKLAAIEATERWGTGSGASRLVVGARSLHRELEAELAQWKHSEAALLFPTGYAANLGVLTVFGERDTLLISDELNHASIVDGCRLARGQVRVIPHLDLDALARALRTSHRRCLIVFDAVFSMDGDVAPVEDLIALADRHGALLVLDEAHAVLGPDVPASVPKDLPLLRVGTLSKTLGSLGGFVAGTRRAIDLLINRARPFIFTTAPTPGDTAAALAAVRILQSAEGSQLIARLQAAVDRFSPGHRSPILPVIIGDEAATMAASAALLERGLLVPGIRPPTVPTGTSRLRIALSAAHTEDQLDRLDEALAELGFAIGARPPQPDPSAQRRQSPVLPAARPDLVAVMAGTGTEVGKTWVAAALCEHLRRLGIRVVARKPAQSFEPKDLASGGPGTDADVLAKATDDDPEAVCPPHRWYERPMAPPMAAAVLGRPVPSIEELVSEISWPPRTQLGLVESAGGVRAPLAEDGDTVALATALWCDLVVLVADPGLGTLNAVRLCADALDSFDIVVFLNRFNPDEHLHRLNRDWLRSRFGLSVMTDINELGTEILRRLETISANAGFPATRSAP
ncbi:MAG: aminotransferase class I/II-fold pyridoxal phosphate-dependent enzyme [Acidimicrobiales bacterium]|nr:aminotransferase class I/II-fold pyridoxal phosphate-dependent enzyme [Acidimicrobiales bacterium]